MKKLKVAITGHTGFIGNHLCKEYSWDITGIGRKELKLTDAELGRLISGCEVVINLAGAPLVQRWTKNNMEEMYSSRINTTGKLVAAINTLDMKPLVFISSSAVGIYNSTAQHNEESMDFAADFLAEICIDWEEQALRIDKEVRTVILRTGIVLARSGGALQKMWMPFSLGLGAVISPGSQMMPWIHLKDMLKLFDFIIRKNEIRGVVNAVTPDYHSNKSFSRSFGKALKRPVMFKAPGFVFKMMYGKGSVMLQEGKYVIPEVLLNSGFDYTFSTLEEALKFEAEKRD